MFSILFNIKKQGLEQLGIGGVLKVDI